METTLGVRILQRGQRAETGPVRVGITQGVDNTEVKSTAGISPCRIANAIWLRPVNTSPAA
jgi:hypothetical protein